MVIISIASRAMEYNVHRRAESQTIVRRLHPCIRQNHSRPCCHDDCECCGEEAPEESENIRNQKKITAKHRCSGIGGRGLDLAECYKDSIHNSQHWRFAYRWKAKNRNYPKSLMFTDLRLIAHAHKRTMVTTLRSILIVDMIPAHFAIILKSRQFQKFNNDYTLPCWDSYINKYNYKFLKLLAYMDPNEHDNSK